MRKPAGVAGFFVACRTGLFWTMPDVPATVSVSRTKVEEDAPTRVDSARWLFFVAVGLAVVMPLGILATRATVPPDVFLMVMSMQIGVVVIALGVSGLLWHMARKNFSNYATRTRVTWTLESREIEGSLDVSGLGPCEGWRDVTIMCVRLPKRRGKMLAMPSLRVMVDNEEQSLASGTLRDGGKKQDLSLVDKAGKPIRFMISHAEPEDASDELPWEVEISVQGDPNPPETLVATALAAGIEETDRG